MHAHEELVISGFDRAVEKYGHKTAILYLGEAFSYVRLKQLIARFASALHTLGVKKGDKVMLYIPNCPQFLISKIRLREIV